MNKRGVKKYGHTSPKSSYVQFVLKFTRNEYWHRSEITI